MTKQSIQLAFRPLSFSIVLLLGISTTSAAELSDFYFDCSDMSGNTVNCTPTKLSRNIVDFSLEYSSRLIPLGQNDLLSTGFVVNIEYQYKGQTRTTKESVKTLHSQQRPAKFFIRIPHPVDEISEVKIQASGLQFMKNPGR
jgi:hypothetical protein